MIQDVHPKRRIPFDDPTIGFDWATRPR